MASKQLHTSLVGAIVGPARGYFHAWPWSGRYIRPAAPDQFENEGFLASLGYQRGTVVAVRVKDDEVRLTIEARARDGNKGEPGLLGEVNALCVRVEGREERS